MTEGSVDRPKEVEAKPKDTTFIFDVDGVLFNDELEGGYRGEVEKAVLSSKSIQQIIDDRIKLDKVNNPILDETVKRAEIEDKLTQIYRDSLAHARSVPRQASDFSPLFWDESTALEFAERLLEEGMLSNDKYGPSKDFPDQSNPGVRTWPHSGLEWYDLDAKGKDYVYARTMLVRDIYEPLHSIIFQASSGDKKGRFNYPGVEEVLNFAKSIGHIRFWTEGSFMEQYYKLNGLGFYHKYHEDAPFQHRTHTRAGPENKDWFESISSKKKAEIEFLLESLKKLGQKHIIVLEDKAKNIETFLHEAQKAGMADLVIPVWVRQGRHKDTLPEGITMEEALKRFNAVDSIADVPAKATSLLESVDAEGLEPPTPAM